MKCWSTSYCSVAYIYSLHSPPIMRLSSICAVAASVAGGANASPVQNLEARILTPAQCSQLVSIVNVLKEYKATLFCSSFLSIKPATSTSTGWVTSTAYVVPNRSGWQPSYQIGIRTTTITSTITSGTVS